MTPLRSIRRSRFTAPAGRSLVMLLTVFALVVALFGNVLATPYQEGGRNQVAQDGTEAPQEEQPSDVPTEEVPTEPIETSESPPEPSATEVPTSEPVATEPVTTQAQATETPPTEPVASEPAATETAPAELPGPRFTGTLIVIKGVCDDPAYAPYDAVSLAELLANCTPYSTDAAFTYTSSDTGDTLTQSTSGSTTSFEVQPGSFSLQEHLPPNHNSPVVACESTMIGDSIVFIPGNGATINFHIDSSDTLTCYWFNIPIPPTTITVIKGLCDDASFDPYVASPEDLAAHCTQGSGDATFTYQQTNTGAPGEITLTQTTVGSTTTFSVPAGNFSIQETIPAGFGEPVVSCYIDRFDIDIQPEAPAGVIVGHIDLGVAFTCQWYNVGASVPAGSLTVVKYSCGPTVWGISPPCSIYKKGQGFDLLQWTDANWESVGTGTTDTYGRYTWADLRPGSYVLDELGGDWCRISSDNMVKGDKGITVKPGEEAIVQVYNCAATPPSPPVRIVNLLALLLRDMWNPMP